MKSTFYFFASIVILGSCNGNSSDNKSDSTSSDSSGLTKIVEPPKPKRDSISIDIANSKFNCTRSKTVKDVDKVVKLFGADVNVKMDNASFSTDVVIKILNGSWFSLDKKFDGGKIVLDMNSISTVQVGKNNELEMTSPDYLDVKKYPTAILNIKEINAKIAIIDSPGKPNHEKLGDTKHYDINAELTLKDSTAKISPEHVVCTYSDSTSFYPEKISFDFHINGIEWGLNHKNAKVTKDDLLFHVVLVSKKK